MPYNVFTKLYVLYDSLVWPAKTYGADIFSYIDAIRNNSMRFFLGVGKYTPTVAVSGDIV